MTRNPGTAQLEEGEFFVWETKVLILPGLGLSRDLQDQSFGHPGWGLSFSQAVSDVTGFWVIPARRGSSKETTLTTTEARTVSNGWLRGLSGTRFEVREGL